VTPFPLSIMTMTTMAAAAAALPLHTFPHSPQVCFSASLDSLSSGICRLTAPQHPQQALWSVQTHQHQPSAQSHPQLSCPCHYTSAAYASTRVPVPRFELPLQPLSKECMYWWYALTHPSTDFVAVSCRHSTSMCTDPRCAQTCHELRLLHVKLQ
jgi:hypothetical protein